MPDAAPYFDPSKFKTETYIRRIDKPWGYELHFVPEGMPYMGKIIHIKPKARLSLQVHDTKVESWMLIKGKASVAWEDSSGKLIETELKPGLGYNLSLGQKHRLIGITECDVFEVSTPEQGTTWRLEDDYSRPNETPEQRAKERRSKP